MKNNARTRLTHQRRIDNPLRPARIQTGQDGPRHGPQDDGGHTPDPLEQHAAQRRLYTDFLALAFYPGMRPTGPRPERATAA
jgi:hypothetical protein